MKNLMCDLRLQSFQNLPSSFAQRIEIFALIKINQRKKQSFHFKFSHVILHHFIKSICISDISYPYHQSHDATGIHAQNNEAYRIFYLAVKPTLGE
jgi:hypothetical protein